MNSNKEHLVGIFGFIALGVLFASLAFSSVQEKRAFEVTEQAYIKAGYYSCYTPERGEYWSKTPCQE